MARLLDTLLDSCPRLRVLATSRETLGVEGEAVRRISSLSVPDTDRLPAAGELTRYDAVRLFLDRARLRLPTFDLTPENGPAVAEVCRKLEGIPLAIELASARMGTLSVGQISERLRDPLGLLNSGGRTAGSRQQTLRGTLDWSYELLSKSEQTLFVRLSVFAGGWSLEAAEVVGAGNGIEEAEVLDLLSKLVDKSLVISETSRDDAQRYRMLEPVRRYAQEGLQESGEAETVRHRHAEFFLALAEQAEPAVEGAQQAAWSERLEREHDNLRAALSWSLGQGESAELGLRVSAALGEFWYLRGYLSEGRRWLEEALAKSGQAPTAARARALYRVSWLAVLQGDLDRAEEAGEEGLGLEGVELFRTGSGNYAAAELLGTLGIAVLERGDYERAIELFEESLALSQEAGSVRGAAISVFCLGITWRSRGRFGRATELLEEALALCRESGDPALLASILTHLGWTYLLQGDLERATVISEEAAAMLREQNHRVYLADALDSLGWAALLRGHSERAKALFEESLALCQELGDKWTATKSLYGLACTTGTRGEAKRAARLFGAAEALLEPEGYGQSPAERTLREPYLATVRSQLGDAAWEAAREEGKAMTPEQAVEYALSEEEIAAPAAPAAPEESPVGMPSTILTRREEEVAALVAQGLTNRQIASELSISEHTAATHIRRILKKLGLHSRTELAAWVSEQQLSSSDLD